MNPLPNRPLLNNPSIPLSLPNVPSFDQMPYNGRPRKVLPDAGKEFPILNGISSMSGPSSAPILNGPQVPLLERNTGMIQPQPPLTQLAQHSPQPPASSYSASQPDNERDADSENRQLTAIFRPDDDEEWKEKLRLSREAAAQARQAGDVQTGAADGISAWEHRRDDDEEDVKEDDGEVDDEEASVAGEGEGAKVWKAKRTLRK